MRIKLNSVKKAISKGLADSEITCEDFALVSNEAENYGNLKKSTRTKISQRCHIEKKKLI